MALETSLEPVLPLRLTLNSRLQLILGTAQKTLRIAFAIRGIRISAPLCILLEWLVLVGALRVAVCDCCSYLSIKAIDNDSQVCFHCNCLCLYGRECRGRRFCYRNGLDAHGLC